MATKKGKAKSAEAVTYSLDQLHQIPINDINPDPNQPRDYFDPVALEDLSNSIKEHGVIQPVIVRLDDDANLILVAGERRYQAAKKVGLKEIPAILTEGDPAEIALIENALRENLTPVEEAQALLAVKEASNYTDKELAALIGRKRNTVSEILSINKLPEDVKEEIRSNPIYAKNRLIKIAQKKKTDKGMRSEFKKYKETLDKKKSQSRTSRARGSKSSVLNNATEELMDRINDAFEWNEKEKKEILMNLARLRSLIDEFTGEK